MSNVNALSWAQFEGAQFYEIQARFRGNDNRSWTQWLTLKEMHETNSFVQTGIRSGVTYEYRVLPLSGQLQILGTWSHTARRTVPEKPD